MMRDGRRIAVQVTTQARVRTEVVWLNFEPGRMHLHSAGHAGRTPVRASSARPPAGRRVSEDAAGCAPGGARSDAGRRDRVMATVDAAALREELEAAQARIATLRAAGKVFEEVDAVVGVRFPSKGSRCLIDVGREGSGTRWSIPSGPLSPADAPRAGAGSGGCAGGPRRTANDPAEGLGRRGTAVPNGPKPWPRCRTPRTSRSWQNPRNRRVSRCFRDAGSSSGCSVGWAVADVWRRTTNDGWRARWHGCNGPWRASWCAASDGPTPLRQDHNVLMIWCFTSCSDTTV